MLMLTLLFILLGVVSGIAAGVFGVGGGIILVPALVYLFHFTQKSAQGTTLALMIPPVGFFAAYSYYKAGQVNVKAALFIIAGFLIGSYLGAHFATMLPDKRLSRAFAVLIILAGIRMLLAG
jgi:uncharacterized membrane protein YfcA